MPKRFCSHCHRHRSTCASRQRSSFVESATFLLDAWRCQTWSYEQLGECCIVLVVSAQSHFSASDFGVHTAACIKAAKQHGRVRFWAGWRQSEAARDTQDVRLLARCLHELVNCARGMGQHRHEGFTPTIWHIMAHQFFFACSQLTQEEVRAYGAAREQRKREEMEQERRRRHRAQKEQLGGFMAGRYTGRLFADKAYVYIYIYVCVYVPRFVLDMNSRIFVPTWIFRLTRTWCVVAASWCQSQLAAGAEFHKSGHIPFLFSPDSEANADCRLLVVMWHVARAVGPTSGRTLYRGCKTFKTFWAFIIFQMWTALKVRGGGSNAPIPYTQQCVKATGACTSSWWSTERTDNRDSDLKHCHDRFRMFELHRGSSCYSSRFAMRTARTQRIGQRGKKRAYLVQPKAKRGQTWPSLVLSWAKQEPTWAQLGHNLRRTRTCAQLEPNCGPTWRNLVVWRRSWAQDRPNVGKMALHERWTMWRTWKSKPRPKVAQLGTLFRQLHTKLGPTEIYGEHGFKRSVIDTNF